MKHKNKGNWSQGLYELKNKQKYVGSKQPIYRSSWEKRAFFFFFDESINVLKWGSEVLVIPYYFHIDKKMHKYYTDIYAEVKLRNGNVVKYVFEIKPKNQTLKPNPPKRKTIKAMNNYKTSLITFERNIAKWDSTRKYCKDRGLYFKILTENELF